ESQQTETGEIDFASLRILQIGRIFQKSQAHENGSDADRKVDIENPAPGVTVGNPTAESWSKDRCDNYTHGIHRHRLSPFFRRESLQQNCLRYRLQCSATRTLQNPSENQEPKATRNATESRRNRKNRDTGDQEPPAAEESS